MHRWGPRLDWEHLQNWLPGVLGVSAVILLVVVAASMPNPDIYNGTVMPGMGH
jgi:hypothetical protein